MPASKTSGIGKLLQIHPVEINSGLISIPENGLKVGRGDGADLVLNEEAVSREHARIGYQDGRHYLEDLGSTNGTFHNGERIEFTELRPGDRISIGSHIFKLLSGDETEAQYYESIYDMMTQDGLTRITNKRAFLDILKRETQRSLNTNRPLSLIMLDIDHFKSINDTYGHLVGDQVLRVVAQRIRDVVESHVTFARYGGEEFVLLVPEVNATDAAVIAERCRRAIATTEIEGSGHLIPVSISLGVADLQSLSPDTLQPDTDLISYADAKLYQAKHEGRNRVCS
ncbi:GGDEF domain-containing protein [Rubinisphaera margarita]|uniref:GGDEF domain-containing protein n=1 Tax=Rubinisphaera margarita TaxID=2909586 RepID=UPI001EE81C4B|nr:GGDEF domain-containing protein [Rubinisphaera margarita]MCG6156967.1 GGDEF domain-containing protein [Rubinisphaera margarita]